MKGMQRISRGRGFEGVLKYAFERDTPFASPGMLIGGNMSGNNIAELTREFGKSHSLRPDIERPVWHNSLRLPKGDRLSHDEWRDVARDYIEQMGFSPLNQYTAVMHDDSDGQHIHIIASRVALDKSVYLGRNENLISTRIISELERKYELTITKGLEYDENNKIVGRAAKSRATKGEIEQANRTGEAPVRLSLQAMIDASVKGKPSVIAFIERLESQGVTVLPNLASTGKLNGFSFELDGIAFKGSKLGANYSWSKLQKSGVNYEQERDFAELSKRRGEAVAQVSTERQPDATADAGISRAVEPDATTDAGISTAVEPVAHADSGFSTAVESVAVANESVADRVSESVVYAAGASEIGRADDNSGAERRDLDSNAGSATAISSSDAADIRRTDYESGIVEHGSKYTGRRAITSSSEQREEATTGANSDVGAGKNEFECGNNIIKSEPEVDRTNNLDMANSIDFHVSNRGIDADWKSRFKIASANKKSKPHKANTKFDTRDIKLLNPIAFLESRGFSVKKVGVGFSVRLNGDEHYRLDNTRSGWLWCDNHGNNGGDNIDLVREIDGSQVSFVDAVYSLGITERGYVAPVQQAQVDRVCEFEPTKNLSDINTGRRYLSVTRSINDDTISNAERQGFLAYAYGAVAFIGRSVEGVIKAATKRFIYGGGDSPTKMDARGSTKAYAPILHGDAGSKTVWIVEGGTDALALHDIASRNGQPKPTVIVSGGAGARAFIDMTHIQSILKSADKVVVACDREKSADVQSKTDDAHAKQVEKLASIGVIAQTWMTPVGVKDIAEFNVAQQTKAREAEHGHDDDFHSPGWR
jgi:hypothetical protein